jgi:hypothetical protein
MGGIRQGLAGLDPEVADDTAGDVSVLGGGDLPGSIGIEPVQDQAPVQLKGGSDALAPLVVQFAVQRLGQKVGNGECFTLVDEALRNAGAKSASDFGSVAPDADYVWGTSVTMSAVRPGDIIQFRDYRYTRTIETSNPDGSGGTDTDGHERPHHTAIVRSVNGSQITVLEQNAPDGAPVSSNLLFFANSTSTSGNTTTTIAVSGTFRFFRPQPR